MAFDPKDNPLKDVKVKIPTDTPLLNALDKVRAEVGWVSNWEKKLQAQKRLKGTGFKH